MTCKKKGPAGLSDVRFLSALEILPWWRDSGWSFAMQGNICGTLMKNLVHAWLMWTTAYFQGWMTKNHFWNDCPLCWETFWKWWPGQKIYQVITSTLNQMSLQEMELISNDTGPSLHTTCLQLPFAAIICLTGVINRHRNLKDLALSQDPQDLGYYLSLTNWTLG